MSLSSDGSPYREPDVLLGATIERALPALDRHGSSCHGARLLLRHGLLHSQ